MTPPKLRPSTTTETHKPINFAPIKRRRSAVGNIGVGILLLMISLCQADASLLLDFNTDGVLPSAEGATYLGPAPETAAAAVTGGVLILSNYVVYTPPAYRLSAYQVAGAFDHASDCVLEWRAKVDLNDGPDFGPEISLVSSSNTWTFSMDRMETYVWVSQYTRWGSWWSLGIVSGVGFHTFKVAIPANSPTYELYADGVLLGIGTAGTIDINAPHDDGSLYWGGGLSASGNRTSAEWDYIHLESTPPTPPKIVLQPQSQTALVGTNVNITVGVSGSPLYFYQWRMNGTNLPWATGSSLILTNVQLKDSGDYSVVVTNSVGYALSDSAKLLVLAPPCILTQPAGLTGYWGRNVSLSVRVDGSEPLAFQWNKDGVPISWATNSTLLLTNLELTAGGDYSVTISNQVGIAVSSTARLLVNPAGVSLGLYPGLMLEGAIGKNYGIQYTTNASNTNNWITLTNIVLSDPSQLWFDSTCDLTSSDHPRRFYRVVAIP